MIECAPAGAKGETFGNTELSQMEAQIRTLYSPQLDVCVGGRGSG